MITRTQRASLSDYFRFFIGGNPCDVWEFRVGSRRCKIVNKWRAGARLFVDDISVDYNNKRIDVSGKIPVLSATVVDDIGATRKIEVFARAILQVKACVHIDGRPISDDFI